MKSVLRNLISLWDMQEIRNYVRLKLQLSLINYVESFFPLPVYVQETWIFLEEIMQKHSKT